MKNLYSIFTFKPLQNFQLEVSRLSRTCLTKYRSSNESYRFRGIRLESKKVELLEATATQSV